MLIMRKFEISDKYTMADLGLDIFGDSLEELFICGAEGMFDIILGGRQVVVDNQIEIKIRSKSIEQLMVDWLSEVLYLFDARHLIAGSFALKINKAGPDFLLQGRIGTARFDPLKDWADYDIKAVTYHRLRIKQQDKMYQCHIVFDL